MEDRKQRANEIVSSMLDDVSKGNTSIEHVAGEKVVEDGKYLGKDTNSKHVKDIVEDIKMPLEEYGNLFTLASVYIDLRLNRSLTAEFNTICKENHGDIPVKTIDVGKKIFNSGTPWDTLIHAIKDRKYWQDFAVFLSAIMFKLNESMWRVIPTQARIPDPFSNDGNYVTVTIYNISPAVLNEAFKNAINNL